MATFTVERLDYEEDPSGAIVLSTDVVEITTGPAGQDGVDGTDGADGEGVPAGGTVAQRLKKLSGTDYDTGWGAPAQLHVPKISSPSVGTTYPIVGAGLFGEFRARHARLRVGSGAGFTVALLVNGVALSGFGEIEAYPTGEVIVPAGVVIADGSRIDLRVDAGSGSDLSFGLSE